MKPRRRLDQAPAGAFGRHAPRERTARDLDECDQVDAERRRIRDILSVEYSYDELQQIAANMRRDAQRSREIAKMFDELGGHEQVQDALFDVYTWRLAQQRERRRFAPPQRKSAALLQKLRKRHKEYYQRVIADPVRRAERKLKDKARYARRYADPETRERIRAQALASARKNKEKRAAYHRTWQQRIREERTDVYLRRLEKERLRSRAAREDPDLLEKRRRASRECMRRKRERLKREDPQAYRAMLDARNARRTSKRAARRWSARTL